MADPLQETHMYFTNQFVVDRPAAVVFAYVTAFAQIPEWNSEVDSTQLLTAGRVRPGFRFSQRRRLLGRLVDERLSVTHLVADRVVKVSSETSALAFDWSLWDRGSSTFVRSHLRTRLPGVLRLVEPLVAPIAARRIAENMRRFQQRIEAIPA